MTFVAKSRKQRDHCRELLVNLTEEGVGYVVSPFLADNNPPCTILMYKKLYLSTIVLVYS